MEAAVKGLLKAAQDLAGRNGFAVSRHNSGDAPRELFALLRPVQTEHPLIRLGGAGDGGYLVPDDLAGLTACFSPGVDTTAEFERDLLARGLRTFQIDASVDSSPLDDPRNDFERKFLGIETLGDTVTLDDWVAAKVGGGSDDLLLQMDIEGHEWLTLAQSSEATLRRFRIIVLELHFLERIYDAVGATVMLPVLRKLTRLFDVVHLHANNMYPMVVSAGYEVPPLLEVTLIRKDRVTRRSAVTSLPHPLDRDNVPGKPALCVPRAMYIQ